MDAPRISAVIGLGMLAGAASASVIDFESLPGGNTPVDDMAIGNSYNVAEFNFVTFSILDSSGLSDAVFEARGSDDDDGFVSQGAGANDVEAPGFAGQGLGGFFLRDNRDFSDTGTPLSLIITYNEAASGIAPISASGDIWDIDGVDNGGPANGTEQWAVYVTDILGNTTLQGTSPIGTDPANPLDGLPWTWNAFDEDGIASIELRFIGTKEQGLGVAFDNFSSGPLVPTPGALALFGIGGIAATRRRR